MNATKRMLGSNAGAIFYASDPDATKLEYRLCVLIKKKSIHFLSCHDLENVSVKNLPHVF